MVWFRGNRKRDGSGRPARTVSLAKPPARTEAEQAVRESAARMNRVQRQRGAVVRVVESLAEIRRENHLSEKVRAAMGGEVDEHDRSGG